MIPWYVYIIIAAICSSVTSIYRKKTLFSVHALEFTSFRAIITLFLVFITGFFIDLTLEPVQALFIFILAALTTLGIVTRNHVVRHADLSVVAPLGGIMNFFVLFLAIIFLNEIPTLLQFIGITITVGGIVILQYHSSIKATIKAISKKKVLRQFIFALMLFAIATVGMREILLTMSPFTFLFYFWLFISIQTLIIEYFFFGVADIKDFKKEGKKIVFISVFMFLFNVFLYIGMSFPEAQVALTRTLSGIGTVFVTFAGGKVFNEGNLLKKTIASVIIVLGSMLIVL